MTNERVTEVIFQSVSAALLLSFAEIVYMYFFAPKAFHVLYEK